jgi:hypothetical protein
MSPSPAVSVTSPWWARMISRKLEKYASIIWFSRIEDSRCSSGSTPPGGARRPDGSRSGPPSLRSGPCRPRRSCRATRSGERDAVTVAAATPGVICPHVASLGVVHVVGGVRHRLPAQGGRERRLGRHVNPEASARRGRRGPRVGPLGPRLAAHPVPRRDLTIPSQARDRSFPGSQPNAHLVQPNRCPEVAARPSPEEPRSSSLQSRGGQGTPRGACRSAIPTAPWPARVSTGTSPSSPVIAGAGLPGSGGLRAIPGRPGCSRRP